MRGTDHRSGSLFSYVDLEARVPGSNPLRRRDRAAAIYTLIATAKLNEVDPRAWLADLLARIADHPVRSLHELLPWNWKQNALAIAA